MGASSIVPNGRSVPRIAEIDGVRFFLVFWIIIYHVLLATEMSHRLPRYLQLLAAGPYAVDVFMIISGFVVMGLLEQKRERYGAFIVRRFFRLYPVYIVCLLLALIVRPDRIPMSGIGTTLAIHLAMLQGLFSVGYFPLRNHLLPPSWAISLEWQFYLVAPLAFYLVKRGRLGFLLVSFVTYLCVRYSAWFGEHSWPSFLPLRAQMFWLGGVSYWVYSRTPESGAPNPVLRFLPEGFLWFCAYWGLLYQLVYPGPLTPIIIWGIVFSAIMARKFSNGSLLSWALCRVLASPACGYLGRLSYCAFLFHGVLILIARWTVAPQRLDPSTWHTFWLTAAWLVPLTLVGSLLLYRFVEVPGGKAGFRVAARLGAKEARPC